MNPRTPKTAAPVRRHLLISGVVQGVFFRDSARRLAVSLRVTGFVRNLQDGRVELVAEGETEKVEELIAWCRRGPSGARVENVEIREEVYEGGFSGFLILRTA